MGGNLVKLAFGADHAGFCLRRDLAEWAKGQGWEVAEFGAESTEPYDYPDAADLVARELERKTVDFGVLVCGSGIGVDIRANRYDFIRAANCTSTEMAELSRLHNHANVLCLGARLMDSEKAKEILETFLQTQESQEPRHIRRVEKMDRDVSKC
jgi:ribose 5-phosphate isomerase B